MINLGGGYADGFAVALPYNVKIKAITDVAERVRMLMLKSGSDQHVSDKVTTIKVNTPPGDHGGGDLAFMRSFI